MTDQTDTAELVSDERVLWQWDRINPCLKGRLAVIWFARAVIDDYRAATSGDRLRSHEISRCIRCGYLQGHAKDCPTGAGR